MSEEATKLQIIQRLTGTIAEPILSHESGMNLMLNNPDVTAMLMLDTIQTYPVFLLALELKMADSAIPGALDQKLPNLKPTPQQRQALGDELAVIKIQLLSSFTVDSAQQVQNAPTTAAATSSGITTTEVPPPPKAAKRSEIGTAGAASRQLTNAPSDYDVDVAMATYRPSLTSAAHSAPLQGLYPHTMQQHFGHSVQQGFSLPPAFQNPMGHSHVPHMPSPHSTLPGHPLPQSIQQHLTGLSRNFPFQHSFPRFEMPPPPQSELEHESAEDAQARRDTRGKIIIRTFKLLVAHHEPNKVPAWSETLAKSLTNSRHHFGDSQEAAHIHLITCDMRTTEPHLLAHLIQTKGSWPEPDGPSAAVWFEIAKGNFQHWSRRMIRPLLTAAVDTWQRRMECLNKEPRGSRPAFGLTELDKELEKIDSMDVKWLINTTSKKANFNNNFNNNNNKKDNNKDKKNKKDKKHKKGKDESDSD